MTIQSNRELEVTREKLRGLEQLYAKTVAAPLENAYVRELTLQSLRRTINRMKEEIARFHSGVESTTASE